MRAGESGPLNLAVLCTDLGSAAAAASLAAALRDVGHEVALLTATPPGPAQRAMERLLERRGMDGPLSQLPITMRALLAGDYDLAHAFSPLDAVAAHAWRRLARRPVVLTLTEPLRRERLADRRLRLRVLRGVVESSDAVIVPTREAHAALERWMAVDGRVVGPDDAEGHERLYRRLVA